jgi:predicted  nucleic acid-binding Zn-ribbon protein
MSSPSFTSTVNTNGTEQKAIINAEKEYAELNAPSNPATQHALMLILPVYLTKLMIQVHDGLGSVNNVGNPQAQQFLINVRDNFLSAHEHTLKQYFQYQTFLSQVRSIKNMSNHVLSQDENMMKWIVVHNYADDIRNRLCEMCNYWQSSISTERIQALGKALTNLLSSTVGTQVLRDNDLMALEDKMGFLETKIRTLVTDVRMMELVEKLAALHGDLAYARASIEVARKREEIARQEKERFSHRVTSCEEDEKQHSEVTHAELQKRLQSAKEELRQFEVSMQAAVDQASHRHQSRLNKIHERRRRLENEITSLPPDKQSGDVGFGIFGFWRTKWEITNDNATKRAAIQEQLKTLGNEEKTAEDARKADIDAAISLHTARRQTLESAQSAAEALINADAEKRSALLKDLTSHARTLLDSAIKQIAEAEDQIVRLEKDETTLVTSINDLEARIATLKREHAQIQSAFSAHLESTRNQHTRAMKMQLKALNDSGCASLSSLIFVIQRLHHLAALQNGLMMSGMSLAAPISSTVTDFTNRWDTVIRAKAHVESQYDLLKSQTLLQVMSGSSTDSQRFQPLVDILRDAGVESGVSDALAILNSTDAAELAELETLLRERGVSKLLLGTAKRNLQKATSPDPNSLSSELVQLVYAAFRSLSPVYALAELLPSASNGNSSVRIDEVPANGA